MSLLFTTYIYYFKVYILSLHLLFKIIEIQSFGYQKFSVRSSHLVLDPALYGGSVPGLTPESYVSLLFFMTHLSSYDNIFETETRCFWGNMKVLLGHLYTC